MGLESALWEATRPAFRVRYIHDPTSTPRVPLYASYGFATGPTARAKLARIVRKAPEVVVKVTDRKSTRLTPVTNAHLVCRLLPAKYKINISRTPISYTLISKLISNTLQQNISTY